MAPLVSSVERRAQAQGIAVPVRLAREVTPEPVDDTTRDAVLTPMDVGLNLTPRVQVPPGGRPAPQVVDAIAKLEALTPDTAAARPLTDAVPALTTVNTMGVEDAPDRTDPKSRELGPTLSAAAAVHPPVPFATPVGHVVV